MQYTVKRTYTLRELIARPLPNIPYLTPSTVLEWEIKIGLLEALSAAAAVEGRKIDEATVVFIEYGRILDPDTVTVEARGQTKD